MNYEEAMNGKTRISAAEAKREIAKHATQDCTWEAFVTEFGDMHTYRSALVLEWLGY
jgi:hypothetical protein